MPSQPKPYAGQAGENPPFFRAIADAQMGDFMRRQVDGLLSIDQHRAGTAVDQTENGLERRRPAMVRSVGGLCACSAVYLSTTIALEKAGVIISHAGGLINHDSRIEQTAVFSLK